MRSPPGSPSRGSVAAAPGVPAITVLRRGGGAVALTPEGGSSWVRRGLAVPEPPFWGVREAEHSVEELFQYLDQFVVIRNRWSFTQGQLADEAFEAVLREKAEPLLARWKETLVREPLLRPRALYGYFPVQASGDAAARSTIRPASSLLATLALPAPGRGPAPVHRRLLRTGVERPVRRAAPAAGDPRARDRRSTRAELYQANRYADYYYFHGLATELTEAYAELLHARIRRELGIHGKDARELRQLFSQGYQGSRYSFGYPACPDLEGNGPILDLLGGASIGVELSESLADGP